MSASPTTQNLSRASLRRNRTPRTVLIRMAQDQARADRIRAWKQEHPELTWGTIAEKIGVTERSAIEWQATGAISYENAKKLAKLMSRDVDWLWSGPKGDTPDLPAALNGGPGPQLDRIEQALADISERLGALGALTARIALALNLPDERATPDDGDGDDEVEAVTADLQAATKGASPSAKQPRQAATAARGHARKARGK